MAIELAKNEDTEEIHLLLRACKEHLISQNVFQWDENYPNISHVKNDIAQKTLQKYTHNRRIVGVISFDSSQKPEYESVNWKFTNTPVAVIHRLAVHPKFQGRKFSSKLMDFSEETTRNQGFRSIRLDAYSDNPMLHQYYTKKGYRKAGKIYLPCKELPFICFEKPLKGANLDILSTPTQPLPD